jgi:uncharacterized protein YciI
MAAWIVHATGQPLPETMTKEELVVHAEHLARFQPLLDEGVLAPTGPTPGPVNTGIAILEAEVEATARTIMEDDPVVRQGSARPSHERSGYAQTERLSRHPPQRRSSQAPTR